MGPAATNHTPSCSPPPDYRIAALRVKDACGAGCAGRGPARSLTRTGPLTRDRQLAGKQGTPGPRGTPAGQSGMPVTVREPGQKPQTLRLTRPRSFRDDSFSL